MRKIFRDIPFKTNLPSYQRISFSSLNQTKFKVSLFPGDGIGPEICQSVVQIFSEMKLPIEWHYEKIQKEKVNEEGDLITVETLENIKKKQIWLKGLLIYNKKKNYFNIKFLRPFWHTDWKRSSIFKRNIA